MILMWYFHDNLMYNYETWKKSRMTTTNLSISHSWISFLIIIEPHLQKYDDTFYATNNVLRDKIGLDFLWKMIISSQRSGVNSIYALNRSYSARVDVLFAGPCWVYNYTQ